MRPVREGAQEPAFAEPAVEPVACDDEGVPFLGFSQVKRGVHCLLSPQGLEDHRAPRMDERRLGGDPARLDLALDEGLVARQLLAGASPDPVRAAVADMPDREAAPKDEKRRQGSAHAHIEVAAIAPHARVEVGEEGAPFLPDGREVDGSAARVLRGVGGKRPLEPSGELPDGGGARDLPAREAAHAVADGEKRRVAEGGLGAQHAVRVLIDALRRADERLAADGDHAEPPSLKTPSASTPNGEPA